MKRSTCRRTSSISSSSMRAIAPSTTPTAKCSTISTPSQLGLTATPADIIDHNTFQLFHCEDGLPTFAYSFEEAVNNVPPYLCDFQVMKIQTKFQKEGISKRTISLEDQKKLILRG